MFNKTNIASHATAAIIYCLIIGVGTLVGSLSATEVRINARTVAEFVNVDAGRRIVESDDIFTQNTGALERQIRLQSDRPVSREELREFTSKQVQDWTDAEIQTLKMILADFSAKTESMMLPLPKRMQFVRTTGKEEGGAAYCRGTAVIIPNQLMARSFETLGKTVKHELFHVISNQNLNLRNKMYSIIGFTPIKGFQYPDELAERRLTNPDAPRLEHYLEIRNADDDNSLKVIPLLFANRESFEGGDFFSYLQFEFQVIEIEDGTASAVVKDGKPYLLDPRKQPDYIRQIGNNTAYIIHPEEILADNFVAMIEKIEVPSPEIVEALRNLFEAAGDKKEAGKDN